MLHKIKAFHTLCQQAGYTVNTYHHDFDLGHDQSLHDLATPTTSHHPHKATHQTQDVNNATHNHNDCKQPRHVIRTDQGGELAGNADLCRMVNTHGYLMEPTAPDSSNSNGRAERMHRTLKEKVRCLLYTAGLGVPFWADALTHAVYLYNRTYHSAIDKTPYEAYTKEIPDVSHLLTF